MSSSTYFTAATRRSSSNEYLPFLDYPYAHDPTGIANIAALSTDLLRQLPSEPQDSLWLLQESTSVVHASYTRLQDLLDEKFERLYYLPQAGSCRSLSNSAHRQTLLTNPADSEHAFANYVNQVAAEQNYLLRDAYPDWKHKLSMVRLDPYLDLRFKYRSKETTVRDWFTELQDSVTQWAQKARSAETPDFDDTVSEYTSQSTTHTSVASSDSLAKELGVNSSLSKAKQTIMKQGVGIEHIENMSGGRLSYGTQSTM